MAHHHFNDQTSHGRMLRRFLQMAEESDDLMADVRDAMIQMRTGETADDYVVVATRFGFANSAEARLAFLELDSAYSKTSGNGSVQDVRAARDQLFSKLRG